MSLRMEVRLEKGPAIGGMPGEVAEEAAGDRTTLSLKYDEPGAGTADADGPGDGSDQRSCVCLRTPAL